MKHPLIRLSRIVVCFAALSALSASWAAEPDPATAIPAPQAPAIKKDKFHLGPWEHDIGYTQALRVGNTLYLSGSVGGGEMPGAIKQAYDAIARTLAAHRLGFGHVVKENVFTTHLDALKEHKAVRAQYYGTDFPAATWVQVSRLFQPEYVIEVEVIAVFPDETTAAK
jgi:enamine deaminase RidA (YjgF/YER057c/UK114 family)